MQKEIEFICGERHEKVAKKGWCITAAVMAVSVIVCIFCFVRWERKSSDLSFQFEETTYTYKDEYYDVDKLVYLQMVGSRDKEKERKSISCSKMIEKSDGNGTT